MSERSAGLTEEGGGRAPSFVPRLPAVLRDLGFFWKLTTIFAGVALAAAVGVALLAQRAHLGTASGEKLAATESPGLALALALERDAGEAVLDLREAEADVPARAHWLAAYAESRDRAVQEATAYASLPGLAAEARDGAAAASAALDSLAAGGDAVAAGLRSGSAPGALAAGFGAVQVRLGRVRAVARPAEAGHRERGQELASQVSGAWAAYARLTLLGLLLFVAAGVVVSALLSREFGGPIGRLAIVSERVSRGDLAVDAVRLGRGDEIGRLAASFDRMVPYLRDMLGRIQALSRELTSSASMISQAGGETAESLSELNAAIEQITEGAQEQAQASQESAEVVLEMSASIQSVAGGAAEIAEGAGRAVEVARRGGETVEAAIAGMKDMRQSVVGAAALVGELGERTTRIGSIVEVISQIAARTNLLALNAAIEAARAGEHGRGFAVVADEVRKLADGSRRSAAEIAELVAGIQEGTRRALDGMEAGVTRVEREADRAQEATRALADIIAAVEATGARVGQISGDAALLAERAGRVSTLVQDVAAVAQESAASAEEMGAQSLQVAAAMAAIAATDAEGGQENASATATLLRMAGELRDLAAEFRV